MKSLFIAALLIVPASGSQAQSAAIIGTWRGTSTCVDKVRHPGCNNEVAHYEVRAVSGARDTVTVNAGKIVNGVRELVSEDNFVRQPDGSWVAHIQSPRFHLTVKLTMAGDRMTGEMVDLADKSRLREIALQRVDTK